MSITFKLVHSLYNSCKKTWTYTQAINTLSISSLQSSLLTFQ